MPNVLNVLRRQRRSYNLSPPFVQKIGGEYYFQDLQWFSGAPTPEDEFLCSPTSTSLPPFSICASTSLPTSPPVLSIFFLSSLNSRRTWSECETAARGKHPSVAAGAIQGGRSEHLSVVLAQSSSCQGDGKYLSLEEWVVGCRG